MGTVTDVKFAGGVTANAGGETVDAGGKTAESGCETAASCRTFFGRLATSFQGAE